MNTITLSNAAYKNAKHYADTQNLSVDEFVVMLIDRFTHSKANKKKYKMLPTEMLEPDIQDILNMPRTGKLDADDVNGEKARMEYYKEKHML
jgi:hypothetical protein